jgi:hypothetical protein
MHAGLPKTHASFHYKSQRRSRTKEEKRRGEEERLQCGEKQKGDSLGEREKIERLEK